MANHRIDYLALDRDLLKRCCPVPPIKFALSKSNDWEILPLDQKFPNAYTPSKQVLYSCNKVGASLFASRNPDFDLRDPYMYNSHATVEYNELHDAALESYFQKPVMRKRLQALNLVNERDDAVCSRRYFFQYLRYLEMQRSNKILKALTQEVINHDDISIRIIQYLLEFTAHGKNKRSPKRVE